MNRNFTVIWLVCGGYNFNLRMLGFEKQQDHPKQVSNIYSIQSLSDQFYAGLFCVNVR